MEVRDEKYRTMADMSDDEIFNAMKVMADADGFNIRDMGIFRSYFDEDKKEDIKEIKLIVLVSSCDKDARCELASKALKYFMGFSTHTGDEYDTSDFYEGMYEADSDLFIYDKDNAESKDAYDSMIEIEKEYSTDMSCWKDGDDLWMML